MASCIHLKERTQIPRTTYQVQPDFGQPRSRAQITLNKAIICTIRTAEQKQEGKHGRNRHKVIASLPCTRSPKIASHMHVQSLSLNDVERYARTSKTDVHHRNGSVQRKESSHRRRQVRRPWKCQCVLCPFSDAALVDLTGTPTRRTHCETRLISQSVGDKQTAHETQTNGTQRQILELLSRTVKFLQAQKILLRFLFHLRPDFQRRGQTRISSRARMSTKCMTVRDFGTDGARFGTKNLTRNSLDLPLRAFLPLLFARQTVFCEYLGSSLVLTPTRSYLLQIKIACACASEAFGSIHTERGVTCTSLRARCLLTLCTDAMMIHRASVKQASGASVSKLSDYHKQMFTVCTLRPESLKECCIQSSSNVE